MSVGRFTCSNHFMYEYIWYSIPLSMVLSFPPLYTCMDSGTENRRNTAKHREAPKTFVGIGDMQVDVDI